MEKINCPICETDNFSFILEGNDTLHNLDGKFKVIKCLNCGLMLTNPRPDIQEIKKYYPDSYSPYGLDFKQVKKIANLRKKHKLFFKIIDPKMTLDLDLDQEKVNVLEIGCGAGNFLYELKFLHPTWNIKGTDFSEKIVDILKNYGMDVFVSDLTNLNIKNRSVDIIYGWMIIEHVHNINNALAEIHRVLKENGKFIFSIPNAGSWEFKFFGKKWFALQLPTHLYHFTENSIAKLLIKSGFKIEKIFHQKNITNIFLSFKIIIEKSFLPKNVKKILSKVFEWNVIYFFLTLPIATILSMMKQSGRLTIIASKKNG